MRRRQTGEGRGRIVEDAIHRTSWAKRLGTPLPSLEHLSADEVAFVHDVEANRAGPGTLRSLIEDRFGPYTRENH